MDKTNFLKFGPETAYQATRSKAYIALAAGRTRKQIGSDVLIGGEHDSLASFKAEVDKVRQDLDQALTEAEAYFASGGSH